MSGDFETWLTEKLQSLSVDDEVYSPYILSILNDDEEDKEESLTDILEGFDLQKPNSPCSLRKEILSHWSDVVQQNGAETSESNDAKVKPSSAVDLGATLASITETQSRAYAAKGAAGSSKDDKDRLAVKAAILAQYNNAVEESSGSEDEGNEAGGADDGLMAKNVNAESVAKAQVEQREKSRVAAQAKKDKDKEDREKQKKDQEDRKKKAQEKAAKGERRR